MHILIESTLNTLQKTKSLLINLSDENFANTSVSPYHSSIGSHVRHILDFYDCIVNEDANRIDLTARSRNRLVETCCDTANDYLNSIVLRLKMLNEDFDREITVVDDLGLGTVEISYTFGALLAQANSHTIHHYAIINYVLNGLNIVIKDEEFGYNPTTPKKETTLN